MTRRTMRRFTCDCLVGGQLPRMKPRPAPAIETRDGGRVVHVDIGQVLRHLGLLAPHRVVKSRK